MEHIEGVKLTKDNRLEVTDNITDNPNYWFGDYQQKGDRYNIPNAEKFHLIPWGEFALKAQRNGIEVVNCTTKTNLKCFRRSTIEKELEA